MAVQLTIKKQDITKLDVDCIVNAANSQLRHGGGVCGVIFAAAGAKELQDACNQYGYCDTGDAVITPGFRLKAKYIVHAVGPIWQGGTENEEQLLYSCYQNAMKVAYNKGCRSIAFPLISSGIFGYPVKEAWEVAVKAIQQSPCEMDVTIAVIDDKALTLGIKVLEETGVMQPKSKASKYLFFWHEYEENGYFSQWYPAAFRIEGIRYCHNEQYMMAKKALLFGDSDTYCEIMFETDPATCKALGKKVSNFDQKLWDSCKEEIVYNANFAKFSQNPELKEALIGTGTLALVEASPYDKIWGIGMKESDPDSKDPAKWKGQNLLGEILMQVREDLLKKDMLLYMRYKK